LTLIKKEHSLYNFTFSIHDFLTHLFL